MLSLSFFPTHSPSFLQPVLTTWASVVTWTSLRASACRRSGSPFWMTLDSRSWRGLRALSSSYVCQWTAFWENLGRLQSSSTTLCLTVSGLIYLKFTFPTLCVQYFGNSSTSLGKAVPICLSVCLLPVFTDIQVLRGWITLNLEIPDFSFSYSSS